MNPTTSLHLDTMRRYEEKQTRARDDLRARYQNAYLAIPEIKAIDDAMAQLTVDEAKQILTERKAQTPVYQEQMKTLIASKHTLLMRAGLPANYLEIHYTCPDCQDTGYIHGQYCHCYKKSITNYLYEKSNITRLLEKENFSTFTTAFHAASPADPTTKKTPLKTLLEAKEICEGFIKNFDTDFQNLLFLGQPGVGKTFLTNCIAKELLDSSHFVLYFTSPAFFDIWSKHTFERDPDASEICNHILDCDLLILDDLGTELSNSFTTERLLYCLNERFRKEKSTLISTNLNFDQLKEHYLDRSFSRISGLFTHIRLTGKDIRIQKKLLEKNNKAK